VLEPAAPPAPTPPAPAPAPTEANPPKETAAERCKDEGGKEVGGKCEKEPSGGSKGGGDKGGEGAAKEPSPTLEVSAPTGVVRPSAVVPLRIEIEAPAAEPLRRAVVCNTLGPHLTRLRSPGADIESGVVCWNLPKVAAGKRRTVTTTARVDATHRTTLRSRTVVRVRGGRTVERTTKIHVRPLPATACGSSTAISPRC
jgi:hypothetical protein